MLTRQRVQNLWKLLENAKLPERKGSSYTLPGGGASEGEAGEFTKGQEEPFEDEGHFINFLLMMASHVNTNSKFSKLYSLLCINHTPSVLGLLVSRSLHNVQGH